MLIRIATRRSKLALVQSQWVKERLEALGPQVRVALREYVTRGDRVQDVPLSQVGGKGLFTKEIEEALLAGDAEVAVHSLKDLPSEMPAGLMLGAVPVREDARDAIVLPLSGADGSMEVWEYGSSAGTEPGSDSHTSTLPHFHTILPRGARVGSSSLRRQAQLLNARPDLDVETVRGNVDTRLRKLDEGQFSAIVLAAAGLNRLGLAARISEPIPPELSTPAPGQGALGLQCRSDDAGTRALLAQLNDAETRTCVAAERAVMEAIGGGCSVPLGAYAHVSEGALHLIAMVASPDGTRLIRDFHCGPLREPERVGREAAARLVEAGARSILDGLSS